MTLDDKKQMDKTPNHFPLTESSDHRFSLQTLECFAPMDSKLARLLLRKDYFLKQKVLLRPHFSVLKHLKRLGESGMRV